MAFDSCMTAAVTAELSRSLTGARIEKVQQPEKDEIVLQLHRDRAAYRLLISASAGNPRIGLSQIVKENPLAAPMFCMLLRKHLIGARVVKISQPNFDRVIEIELDAMDEMNFTQPRYLIVEMMGTYSNIIFCGNEKKIIAALRIIDFSTSQKRQVLPGMRYELPPAQEKMNPLETNHDTFLAAHTACASALGNEADEKFPEKFLASNFFGMSRLTMREMVHLAGAKPSADTLWNAFDSIISRIRHADFIPTLITDATGRPVEYSCFPITQYGSSMTVQTMDSFGALIDAYFSERDRIDHLRQRASDITRLLTNAKNRLTKKIALQQADLDACANKAQYKEYGDLITSNLYQLQRGMKEVRLTNYYSENMEEVVLALDTRLTPSQNAQRYYKRYNKAKSAEQELVRQISIAKEELHYIDSVEESLARTETEAELDEIRRELYLSGFASRMKHHSLTATRKPKPTKPLTFVTDGGYRVLCGKNNSQNDLLTCKIADKNDYWFHVKNAPGSHVVLFTEGTEPSEADFTQAAIIAATHSSESKGVHVPVDYTLIRYVKKPSGSKPGFVIYTQNYTAYVTPDEGLIRRLRKSE